MDLRDRFLDWLRYAPRIDLIVAFAGVVVLLSLISLGLFFRQDARGEGRAPTTSPVPTTTGDPAPTVSGATSTTADTTTTAPVATTTTAATPPETTPPTTSAPAAPAEVPRQTTAPTRVRTSAPVCGFAPGSAVDIDLNGRPLGRYTADGDGCVAVPVQ